MNAAVWSNRARTWAKVEQGLPLFLFLMALAPRLWAAWNLTQEPVWDAHYYDFGAKRIAQGLGYSDDLITPSGAVWHPWAHYPVGTSAFLGLVYRVFGAGRFVGPTANAFVGAALAPLTFVLLRSKCRFRAGLAAMLVALSPGLILYTVPLMSELLSAAFILLTPWIYSLVRERRSAMWAISASGAALGLATLVRPPALLLVPFLIWLERDSLSLKRKGLLGMTALASALTVIAPWTARNCHVMDGCALVSTNGGWNLAIGSSPRATGRFDSLHASDGCPVVTGQVQQDRCWFDQGLTWISENPARYLALMPKKLSFTFDHESFAVAYLGEANPTRFDEAWRQRWRNWNTWLFGIPLLLSPMVFASPPWRRNVPLGTRIASSMLALIMVILLALSVRADKPVFWPAAILVSAMCLVTRPRPLQRVEPTLRFFAAAILTVCITSCVFFGEDRYHMVLWPAIAALSCFSLSQPSAPNGENPAAVLASERI